MKKHSLKAQKRTVTGRKVKALRESGQLPATVYGKGVKSISVSVSTKEFTKLYGEVGETGLVELALDGDVRPTLVHTVQKNPVSGELLHIEFHQVDLKQKVHAKVPLELVGEAAAVAQKTGVLLTLVDEVEVEALPTDLPEQLTIDVSALAKVNEELKVSDIKVPAGVAVLTDANLSVVKVGSLVSREAEAEAAAEAAAKAEAAAAAEAAAGETAEAQKSEVAPAPTEEKAPPAEEK